MANWAEEEPREALATISTLKRVLGIPNHMIKKDTFNEQNGRVCIYTPDEQSAVLLGELLYRYGTGNQAAHYKEHPEFVTLRDTIRVEELQEGGFETSMSAPWPISMKKALEKMIKKYTGPDTRFRR